MQKPMRSAGSPATQPGKSGTRASATERLSSADGGMYLSGRPQFGRVRRSTQFQTAFSIGKTRSYDALKLFGDSAEKGRMRRGLARPFEKGKEKQAEGKNDVFLSAWFWRAHACGARMRVYACDTNKTGKNPANKFDNKHDPGANRVFIAIHKPGVGTVTAIE